MPRRDGFPTNREMVVDFNTLSRTAYVDAYNRVEEDGLPAALQDKPLGALYLNVVKRVPKYMMIPDGVTAEQLLVQPLQNLDVELIPETLGFRDTPEDVLQHYRELSRRIGETTVHSGLDIASALPPSSIVADYTAFYPGTKTRHISTFKEKPSKLSIASGTFFAEQAIEHINTPREDRLVDVRDFMQVVAHMQKPARQGGTFEHVLSLRMEPNLPLNGHESKAFLNAYANRMFDKARLAGAHLERSKALGAPDIIIENNQAIYDQANESYKRAQELLDKK